MTRLTAKQKKSATRIIAAIKCHEFTMDRQAFFERAEGFITGEDDVEARTWAHVEREVRAWAEDGRTACEKLRVDLEAIEQADSKPGTRVYLYDFSTAHQNATDGNDLTELSIGYWPEILRHLCAFAGMQAEEIGMDINARLGRVIY